MRARDKIGTQEPTRYEVVLSHESERVRLGFTERVGKHGLWPYITRNIERLYSLGAPTGARVRFAGGSTKCRAEIEGGLTILFSGRTEREVASLTAEAAQ